MKYEDFEPIRFLGSGGFGKVLLVRKITEGKHCGKLFALKVMKKSRVCRLKSDIKHTWAERSILQTLEHPFLVKLYYAFQDETKLFLALEYCPGGELFNYLEKCTYLPEEHACFYLSEVLLALGYLHSNGVIYRDVKPENILLDREGHCKLTDFNLAVQTFDFTETFCGTSEYIAPEMYMQEPYDKNVDWWCLGILLYDMLSGNPPWFGTKAELKEQILHAAVPMLIEFSPDAYDLIDRLLQRSPLERLGAGEEDAEDIKKHAFFQHFNVNWEKLLSRQVKPPFCPHFQDETDTSFFCNEFTSVPPRLSFAQTVSDDPFLNFSYAGSEVSDWENSYQHAKTGHKRRSFSRSISDTSSHSVEHSENSSHAIDIRPSRGSPHFHGSSYRSLNKRPFLVSNDFVPLTYSNEKLQEDTKTGWFHEDWNYYHSTDLMSIPDEESVIQVEPTPSASSVFILIDSDDSDADEEELHVPSLVCIKPPGTPLSHQYSSFRKPTNHTACNGERSTQLHLASLME